MKEYIPLLLKDGGVTTQRPIILSEAEWNRFYNKPRGYNKKVFKLRKRLDSKGRIYWSLRPKKRGWSYTKTKGLHRVDAATMYRRSRAAKMAARKRSKSKRKIATMKAKVTRKYRTQRYGSRK